MKKTNSLAIVLLLAASVVCAQTSPKVENERELQRAVLLSEVKILALEIPKLDSSLARAMAGAEVADAAWTLDRKWAKSLLKDAYQLTYLTEEEQRLIGDEPPGTPPRPPNDLTRARSDVRKRVMSIARRDAAFANQLLNDTSSRLTKDDRQMTYGQMTVMAMDAGDNQAAARLIEQNMAIDPSQFMLAELVNDLAKKDRAAADKLILQFIERLSQVQLAGGKIAIARADVVLHWLVFPNSFFPDYEDMPPNPGAEVMKTYVRYVLDSLTGLEQSDPGGLPAQRMKLLSTWLPLNQYAPELKERFMQLEAASRTPGKDASLPTKSSEELDKELMRKREAEALNSATPNEYIIGTIIGRGDFELARKAIDKLPDGERKAQLMERVNVKEAISLARKRDLLAAQNVATRLTTANSIRQVYPVIIQAYANNKDQAAASAAANEAVKQLERVNKKSSEAVLVTLGELAAAVLTVDTLLAAEIVDDIVAKANRTPMDTTQGRTSIDGKLFSTLASKDDVRARSAAQSFKDRLQRIVALAAVYQWKAKELDSEIRKPKP